MFLVKQLQISALALVLAFFAALPASVASVASEEDTPVGNTPVPAVEEAILDLPAPPQLDPGVQYPANLFSA